jgi:hypothetical protein
VPFKHHSKGRRHIPRQRHRVTNWPDYDAALRNRGQPDCLVQVRFEQPDSIAGTSSQPFGARGIRMISVTCRGSPQRPRASARARRFCR